MILFICVILFQYYGDPEYRANKESRWCGNAFGLSTQTADTAASSPPVHCAVHR